MGCPEHVDSSVITVVAHLGDAGLEVYDQHTHAWFDVECAGNGPGTNRVVLLVGHTLQVASGGRYQAALHRVASCSRRSLVFKLHLDPGAWLSAANTTVASLMEEFSLARPSINPTANDSGRSSALSSLVFSDRDVSADAFATHLCVFQEDLNEATRSLMPIFVPVKAPIKDPLLRNRYFVIWAITAWSTRYGVHLPPEIRAHIFTLQRWVPTTAMDVINALVAHLAGYPKRQNEQPRDLKLVVGGGRLLHADSPEANRPFLEAFGANASSSAVISSLHFVRFRSPVITDFGAHVALRVATQDGNVMDFVCREREQLAGVMFAFATRQRVSIEAIRFLFDGTRIRLEQTPTELDMENGDFIDVMVEMMGD